MTCDDDMRLDVHAGTERFVQVVDSYLRLECPRLIVRNGTDHGHVTVKRLVLECEIGNPGFLIHGNERKIGIGDIHFCQDYPIAHDGGNLRTRRDVIPVHDLGQFHDPTRQGGPDVEFVEFRYGAVEGVLGIGHRGTQRLQFAVRNNPFADLP